MLTEFFIATAINPPSLTSGAAPTHLRDATIFLHTYRPHSRLDGTLKKSSTGPNALAVSSTHIFALQREKATVNVYKRSTASQEQTVHFPQRLTSCTLACDDSVLCLGTAEGRFFLWELATGRCVAVPAVHYKPVAHLAADPAGAFLLSAAEDAIFVWSLRALLAFSTDSFHTGNLIEPHQKLSAHNDSITAITVGHAAAITGTNICVSAAKDNAIIVWAYETGTQLRTFLAPSAPLCMTLDPADRAVYAAYDDGSVSCFPFYAPSTVAAPATTPIKPPRNSHWQNPSTIPSPAQSIAIDYTGTNLLTGHAGGKITEWNVGDARFVRDVADYPGASISNLLFLEPTGWPAQRLKKRPSRWHLDKVVKPRVGANANVVDEGYVFTAAMTCQIIATNHSLPRHEDIAGAVLGVGFPLSMLEQSLADLTAPSSAPAETDADFMALDGGDGGRDASEIAKLKRQVENMEKQQDLAKRQIQALVEERVNILRLRDDFEKRRREKAARRRARAEKAWDQTTTGANGDVDMQSSDSEADDVELKT